MRSGIIEVTHGKLLLKAPPDRPRQGTLRYALGFPFQTGPRTIGVMTMRTIEGTPNYGFLDGSDVILLDELKLSGRERIFAASRNELEEGKGGEPPRLLIKSPLMGGFVPLGALRVDGTPHPHAGTGFGIAQAHWFPFRDGQFSWGDRQRQDMIEVYRLAYDGNTFASRRTGVWPQNAGSPLRIGDTGWHIMLTGLSNAIPDGDDLLMAALAARIDRSAVSAGAVRWSRRDGAWQPVGFDPVAVVPANVPDGPNPMERCPWMEPSLARDADDGLLFSVRCADSFQQPGDVGQGYRLCLWRSTERGQWAEVLDTSNARLNSPVTVNVAADGSAYMASNPYDPAFVPETNVSGRGREKLVLWPLDAKRRRLEPARLIRDALGEFGAPPSAATPEQWMVDHPNGATLRLKDGNWRHVLLYRVCHCPRYRASGMPPSPHNGCWIEEVVSRGDVRPVWRFEGDRDEGQRCEG